MIVRTMPIRFVLRNVSTLSMLPAILITKYHCTGTYTASTEHNLESTAFLTWPTHSP